MMTTKGEVTSKRVVPRFDNEADEAQWWFDNRDLIEQDFVEAFESGLSRPVLRYKVAAAEASAVTLNPADVVLARELAAKRGERYEDFVRRVMHRALQLEKSA